MGAKILLKKDDRDEEFFFAPTKKKGPSKKTSTAIKHNVETFKLFDTLKLDAPITTEEVPPIIEKLEKQLADYNAKVEVWKKEREAVARGEKKLDEDKADGEEEKNADEE